MEKRIFGITTMVEKIMEAEVHQDYNEGLKNPESIGEYPPKKHAIKEELNISPHWFTKK